MPCPGDPGPRPTFIPIPNTARTVMRYEIFGQTVENVLYFERDDDYTAFELDILNGDVVDHWATFLRPHLPAAALLVDVTSTDQSVVSGAQDIDAVSVAGSNVGAPFETTGNTFAFKFGTGLSGRSYRGRMYWPILMASEVNDGKLSAVFAAQVRDALEDFFGAIAASNGNRHVVASYQNDCEWRTTGVHTPVSSYSYTDLNLDSQRRRLPGRGI